MAGWKRPAIFIYGLIIDSSFTNHPTTIVPAYRRDKLSFHIFGFEKQRLWYS
jgi:hypothetical protein